jgi:hypothetical protein
MDSEHIPLDEAVEWPVEGEGHNCRKNGSTDPDYDLNPLEVQGKNRPGDQDQIGDCQENKENERDEDPVGPQLDLIGPARPGM